MKKLVLTGSILTIGWILWPYYALYDFVSALQSGDQELLERRVDWQPLRQGLRDDFNLMLMKKVAQDAQNKQDQPGATLGAGLAAIIGPAIIDRAIEAYVTPAGIAALIKSGKPSTAQEPLGKANRGAMPVSSRASRTQGGFSVDRIKYAFFSGGPSTFRVEIAPPDGAVTGGNGVLVFKWAGDWRLNRIVFPKEVLEGS